MDEAMYYDEYNYNPWEGIPYRLGEFKSNEEYKKFKRKYMFNSEDFKKHKSLHWWVLMGYNQSKYSPLDSRLLIRVWNARTPTAENCDGLIEEI